MMRMRFAAILLVGLISTPLAAAPIAEETFEGLTVGDLNLQGSGAGWSGNWSATTGGEEVINAALSYTFSGGQTVDGGASALQINGGVNNNTLLQRDFASPDSSDEVYFSFLYRRTAGTGGSNALDDFVMWWFTSDSSNAPNIGVFDESSAGNHLVARNNVSQSNWAQGGGSSNTVDTYFVVARMTKGNQETNPNDYDGVALWVFNDSTARSVLAFQSPDATGVQASSRTLLNSLGLRTVGTSASDIFVFDELRVGTSITDVVPVSLVDNSSAAAINGEHVITFSEYDAVNKTVVDGSEALFADNGITGVSAVAANGSDKQNQTGKSGAALYANASEIFILRENENTTGFGETTSFTLDFGRTHKAFGVSFTDEVAADFTIDLYRNGELVGSQTKSIGQVATTPFIVESVVEFDRAVISGGDPGDGWGIDNILYDAVHETTLAEFDNYTVIDFESVAAGATGSNTFVDGELTITATGGGSGSDVASVNTDDGHGLFYDGSQFHIINAGAGGTNFGFGQAYTLDFAANKNLIGMVLTDQGEGNFTFTFYLDGTLQAQYLKTLPNTNNQTFYFATDFLFDRVVVDALGNDGFGLDNITFQLVPEPTSLATLFLGGALLMRRRTRSH